MRRRGLPFDAWPQRDREAWERACAHGDVFDDPGALADRRPATRESYRVNYGLWLAFLRSTAAPYEVETPGARMTRARVAAWLDDLSDLSPVSVWQRLRSVRIVLSALGETPADGALDLAIRRLGRRVAGMPRRDPSHGSTAEDLLRIGLELGETVPDGPMDRASALRLRDAAMLTTLAALPLRPKNFRDLEIGVSFFVRDDGCSVFLSGAVTKAGNDFEAPIPDVAVPLLRRWLADARPELLTLDTARLWINDAGRPYSHGHLGTRIADLTERLLGKRVTAHAAATAFATERPEDVLLAADLLGHRSYRRTESAYNRAGSSDATRRHAALMQKLRDRP